jgi:hypothetical protein
MLSLCFALGVELGVEIGRGAAVNTQSIAKSRWVLVFNHVKDATVAVNKHVRASIMIVQPHGIPFGI